MNCYICGTYLGSSRFLRHHFRRSHDLSEKDTYKCTFGDGCNKCFALLSSLNRHFTEHLQFTQRQDQLMNFDTNVQLSPSNSSISSIACSPISPENHLSNALANSEKMNDDFNNLPDCLTPHDFDETITRSNLQENIIAKKGIEFVLKMHCKDNFTRKNVVEVQEYVMQNIVDPIIGSVTEILEENYSPTTSKSSLDKQLLLTSLTETISHPFRFCKNELQLFKWLRKNDFTCDFNEFIINQEIAEKYSRGSISYDEVDITGVLLPIYFQFRKFFEKDDKLLKTLKYIENLPNIQGINNHFIRGSLWHAKSQHFSSAGQIALPYFLYIDDAEINNPLGPHINPVTFIYYLFPMVKNCEVFLAAAVQGNDYKQYGNRKCLLALVHEIQKLQETGISIETSEGAKTVYFILSLVLGDNLGLNTILGFTSSFNHNYFCRFCKANKMSTQTMSIDDSNLLRNPFNYDEDIDNDDMSRTGIKEASILNSINSFHVTTNFAVDVMHDIFEGVCHYDMCHIITHLINSKYFSLQKLNVRKQMFHYGELEIGNFSPEITEAHLAKFHLKMTAREMMTFIHLFPLMVGDLVPEDDDVWLFLLDLIEIINILLSYEISDGLGERLKLLIKKHHENYVRFFGDSLKPKHHLMLHYFLVIMQSGPPRFYWSYRFEAKHKEFKTYAHSITSRKNICVSIARKYQLKFASYLMEPEAPLYTVQSNHMIKTHHEYLINDFRESNQINSDNFRCYSQCFYNSKIYKKGYFISQYLDSNCLANVLIYQIVEIVLFSDCDSVHLICRKVKVEKFYKHFVAYAIDISNATSQQEYTILCIETLSGPPINVHTTANGLNMIRPNQYY